MVWAIIAIRITDICPLNLLKKFCFRDHIIGTVITFKNSAKYFGVLLDSKLNFNLNILKKTSKILGRT